MNTTTIGLDIAKRLFQAHGMDTRGKTSVTRRPRPSRLRTRMLASSGRCSPMNGTIKRAISRRLFGGRCSSPARPERAANVL
jgi:hypothetical protein